MNTYAIIYICTGAYSILWKDFYSSAEEFFLYDAKKDYYVFTDDKQLTETKSNHVYTFFCKKAGWPYDTLMRWERMCEIQDILQRYDYVVFCNANMQFLDKISSKMFENTDFTLCSFSHDSDKSSEMPLERRKESKAYIPVDTPVEKYVSGRFILGKAESFLDLARTLREWTMEDLRNGIIPIWHDESMENAYFCHYGDRYTIRYVGAEFAAIEELMKDGDSTKAIYRNKDHYGGNVGIRYNMTLGKLDILRRRILGKLRIL